MEPLSPPDGGYPVAWCAPGRKTAAALALWLRGEHVERVEEHPYLAGTGDVYVAYKTPELFIDADSFRALLRIVP